MLANVYLHYVLDEWFAQEVQPRLKGKAFLVRFADDFVMGFTHEEDARRVMAVLGKRFGKYGLTLHPDKTRMVPFRRPPLRKKPRGGPNGDRPGVFDLLGFTHFWATVSTGEVGGAAQDVIQPLHTWITEDLRVVPEEPAPSYRRAMPETESEATRPLCVLRHHGKQPCAELLS